jgi:hypothetical protein
MAILPQQAFGWSDDAVGIRLTAMRAPRGAAGAVATTRTGVDRHQHFLSLVRERSYKERERLRVAGTLAMGSVHRIGTRAGNQRHRDIFRAW